MSSILKPGPVTLSNDDTDHPVSWDIRVVPVPGYSLWCQVEVVDPASGEVRAIAMRLKLTDNGKIAGDLPGCDPNVCNVDGNGSITNG